MKRQLLSAAILSTLMLSACGVDSDTVNSETTFSEAIAEVTDEVTSASKITTTETSAETTVQTIELTTVPEEITAASTEYVSDTSVNLKRERCFGIYEIEVKDGVPEVCDLDAIKARRRSDMADKYTEWRDEHDGYGHSLEEFSDAADYAEKIYGYSFDKSDPVTTYIEDDFDLDGKMEYYLCMAEYITTPLPSETYASNAYSSSIVTSVYYVDDDGKEKNVFSKLVPFANPEPLYGDTAEDALNKNLNPNYGENNLRFQIDCGYGSYHAPVVIDNGDSKHLLWKNDNSYPSDWGAYIFWIDKHCRVEISSPSLSFGGFYEWGDMPEEIFFNERDKFGDDFWATEINLATKLDLYTYPEINGKVNTLKWDGQNYVYNMIERKYDRSPESGPVEWK